MADLVTLEEFQAHSGNTQNSELVEQLIDQYSQVVRDYCNREFTQEEITEYHDGGHNELIVKRPPISSITGVYDAHSNDDEVDFDDYTFEPNTGVIFGSDGNVIDWTAGRRKWKVVYTGDYNGAPDSVKLAMCLMISKTIAARSAGLTSEKLGDYQYTISADTIPPDIRTLLDKYRVVVL